MALRVGYIGLVFEVTESFVDCYGFAAVVGYIGTVVDDISMLRRPMYN